MSEFVTIQERIERRTYIKGKFSGKFIGYLDRIKSDILHESFYDLEVLSGEIKTTKDENHIRHWETGEPEEFQPIDKFLTRLPEILELVVESKDKSIKNYQINLNEPKLSNYLLSKQVYEDDKVFGDIVGEISGYIKHYDIEEVEIEVFPEEEEKKIINSKNTSVKTSKQTGRTELNGSHKRWEYYNSDGTTYWGNWIKQNTKSDFSFIDFFGGLLQLVFSLLVFIPLFVVGWQIVLPLIIIAGIVYIISSFQPVIMRLWSYLIQLIGLAFSMLLVFGIISIFTHANQTKVKRNEAVNSAEEKTDTKIDEISGDSIISHYRVWQDYNKKEYTGTIKVKVANLTNLRNFRNNISVSPENSDQYNYIVSKLYDFDKNKLGLLYQMFDSLKKKHALNENKFAEMITSCIQDIPYTLVLDRECNANQYNDNFIREYLSSGGKCEGNIKFGLLSPTEFMGSLVGDCDTRTLLLFTVLNHYNFDVAMLGSELYKHSVIGINLPFNGIAKIINGKRYVIWETTQHGIPPGVIPREVSDMRFWNVTLISTNNTAI
jgi:hypothetical protein